MFGKIIVELLGVCLGNGFFSDGGGFSNRFAKFEGGLRQICMLSWRVLVWRDRGNTQNAVLESCELIWWELIQIIKVKCGDVLNR